MRGHLHPVRKKNLSVRNPERKNAKQILKISSVLLSRDRSALSWWHEEKKMEAATHSTSHSLRSARLSVCLSSVSLSLSLSLSFTLTLSFSLSFADIECPPLLSSQDLVFGPFPGSPAGQRTVRIFSNLKDKKKKKTLLQLLELTGREGTEQNCCYYRNVMNVFIFHQKGVYIL